MSESNLDSTQKLNMSLVDLDGKYLSQNLIERLNLNDNKLITSSGFTIYKPQPRLKQPDKYNNSIFKINHNNSLDQSFMTLNNDSQSKTFQQVDQFRHHVLNSSFKSVKHEHNRSQNNEVNSEVAKSLNQISATQKNSAEKMDTVLATLLQLDEKLKKNLAKTDKFEIQLNAFNHVLSSQNANIDERLNKVLYKIKKLLDDKVEIFHSLAEDISVAKKIFLNLEEQIEKKVEKRMIEIQNQISYSFDEMAKKLENENNSSKTKQSYLREKMTANEKSKRVKISKNIADRYKIKSNITRRRTFKNDALNGVKKYIKNVSSDSSSMIAETSLDKIENMEGVEFKNFNSTYFNPFNLRAKRVLNDFSYQEKSSNISKTSRSNASDSNTHLNLDSDEPEIDDQILFLDMI